MQSGALRKLGTGWELREIWVWEGGGVTKKKFFPAPSLPFLPVQNLIEKKKKKEKEKNIKLEKSTRGM